MLSDIFGDFEIEDNFEETKVKFCSAESYTAESHNEGWFFDAQSSDTEAQVFQAFWHYNRGAYDSALDLFEQHLRVGSHNRGHMSTIYDSIIRCATKSSLLSSEQLKRYLIDYEAVATDYGDQLQFWEASKKALVQMNDSWANHKYLDTVSMLCATMDLPEHWLSFGKNKNIQMGPNFRLAFLVRAAALCERHSSTAHGPAADAIRARLSAIRRKLEDLHESPERLKEARVNMTLDLISMDDRQLLTGTMKRPAHECRSTIGIFKTPEMIIDIVREFRNRFAWMFVDM